MNRKPVFFFLIMSIYLMNCNRELPSEKAAISNERTLQKSWDEEIKEKVMLWDSAHQTKNAALFEDLYNYEVLFYGQQYSIEECISAKEDLFKNLSVFEHKIITDIHIDGDSTSRFIKCSFLKRVKQDKTEADYPAYLYFLRDDDICRIMMESDGTTDERLKDMYSEKNRKEHSIHSLSMLSGELGFEEYEMPGKAIELYKPYFLYLDEPVEVNGYEIESLQLVPYEDINHLIGERVLITGSFFESHTGWHFSLYLLTVFDIQKV